MPARLRVLTAALMAVAVFPLQAGAHSYTDPALRTVYDGLQPSPLPSGVEVAVVPSVVDELLLSNRTSTPLEVLALGGEPFLRISRTGVEANLASPDWYSTGTPEGGPVPPPDVQRDKGTGAPRWARVSTVGAWSEFDSRLHPPAVATPELRKADKDAALAVWRIPLRYGSVMTAATGHVLFSPIRGAFTVAVGAAPEGVTATALQGELPGLFLRAPAGQETVVRGRDGLPFLRFRDGVVQASTSSQSYREDQAARGRAPEPAGRWIQVGSGLTYSWLDGRLRYPSDVPPQDVLARTSASVVGHWTVPVTVVGMAGELTGTISWVPRKVGLAQVGGRSMSKGSPSWLFAVGGAGAAGLVLLVVRRGGR